MIEFFEDETIAIEERLEFAIEHIKLCYKDIDRLQSEIDKMQSEIAWSTTNQMGC